MASVRIACFNFQGLGNGGVFNRCRKFNGMFLQRFSSSASDSPALQDEVVEYPAVKTRYPPGPWGDLSENSAWHIHKLAHEQLAIPRVKERLESLAGEKSRCLWVMNPIDRLPNALEFKQCITRTHIVNGLPKDVYDGIDVDGAYSKIKSLIPELILQEHEYMYKYKLESDVNVQEAADEQRCVVHNMLGSILQTLKTALLPSCDHLFRCQVDEDVRVESFWQSGRFKKDKGLVRGTRLFMNNKDREIVGVLTFQYKHRADWQIRTEQPLPEFVSQDNAVCREGSVPRCDFSPVAIGFESISDRPISVSGHWIGDPCEFSLLSLHTWPTADYLRFQNLGEKYFRQAEVSYGLAAGFGSCLSQAYNQGFTDFLDVTYPFSTQCVLTNGQDFRFFAYQLNTMQLWNEGKTMRNILWASEPLKLYESLENGQVKGLNDEVIKMLMKSFALKPVDRGINLRPYLPEEASPLDKTLYVNHVGQELLPVKKIGRFEYPRNAVYF